MQWPSASFSTPSALVFQHPPVILQTQGGRICLCRQDRRYIPSDQRRRILFPVAPATLGKSLLLSTLEAYYSGRRDLFKGLALDSLTDDWEPYPILHLDLNTGAYDTEDSLDILLDLKLKEWEKEFDISVEPTATHSYRFGALITHLHATTGRKVVVLIDEYDKPMLHAIGNEPLADRFRNTLKAFYGNLKSMDSHIEFAMLTGVARFSKVSIFSDLNNLRDISFSPNFSAICGITNDELDHYFQDGII